MPYEISPLRTTDADVLGPLHNQIWREAYAGLLPREVLASRDDADSTQRWRTRALAHEQDGRSPEGCTTVVARDDEGVAVGWIAVGPARESDGPTPVELWSLYAAREHRGSGVADQLLETLLPPGPAYLWVLAGNDRATAFYRKHGFSLDGVTKEFGETGVAEVRMVRS